MDQGWVLVAILAAFAIHGTDAGCMEAAMQDESSMTCINNYLAVILSTIGNGTTTDDNPMVFIKKICSRELMAALACVLDLAKDCPELAANFQSQGMESQDIITKQCDMLHSLDKCVKDGLLAANLNGTCSEDALVTDANTLCNKIKTDCQKAALEECGSACKQGQTGDNGGNGSPTTSDRASVAIVVTSGLLAMMFSLK